jgi:hypothetical protein
MFYVEIRKTGIPFFTDARYFRHCGPFLESADCFEAQCDIRTGENNRTCIFHEQCTNMEECVNMKYTKTLGSSVIIATALWDGGQKNSILRKSRNLLSSPQHPFRPWTQPPLICMSYFTSLSIFVLCKRPSVWYIIYWKGFGRNLIEVLFRNFPRRTEANHENALRIVVFPDRDSIRPPPEFIYIAWPLHQPPIRCVARAPSMGLVWR